MRRSYAPVVLGCLAALVLAGSVHASDPVVIDESIPVGPGVSYEGGYEGLPGDPSGGVAYLPRFWAEADYLLLWTKSAQTPPLVTTGPLNAIGPGNAPGTIGVNGTLPVQGGDVKLDPASGVRFVLGGWCDDGCKYGVEASYFYLERTTDHSAASGGTAGSTPLSVPFFNAFINMESSAPIALDRPINPIGGRAELSLNERVWGAEALALCCLHEVRGFRLDLVGGYRYLNVEESLDFNTATSNVGQNDIFVTRDSFRCSNEFHGAQIGLRNQIYAGRVFFRGAAKLGLGNMHQETRIDGSFVTNDFPQLAGQTRVFPGGYFTQPTNIGTYSRNRIAFIPEVTTGMGLHLCPWLRVSVSYTFLYITSVMRPGDQMDRAINPTQAPAITGNPNPALMGAPRPASLPDSSDFWLQGLSFGLEMRF